MAEAFHTPAIQMALTRMKKTVAADPLFREMRRQQGIDRDRSRARRGSRERPSR